MKVVVTGSSGRVGQLLIPALRERFELVLIDAATGDDHIQLDICDLDALTAVFENADAVIHLAAKAPYRSTWEEVRTPNIDGAYSVFEAARRAGVSRVVFASSNHVTGMYDIERAWPVDPAIPVRPDGFYGVSKAFGEIMGRYYADNFGMSVICLRIGWVRADPASEAADTGVDIARMMWLSSADLAQLVTRSLSSDVRFGIYYGVSANSTRHWSIENAAADLGYHPVDDSALHF